MRTSSVTIDLAGARVVNPAGIAINADGLRTEDSLFLKGANLRGHDTRGTVRLSGALIRGRLTMEGATVANTRGPAVHADGIRAEDSLFLQQATFSGHGEDWALRFLGAHIGGQAHLRWKALANAHSGQLLSLNEARVTNTLFLPAESVCPQRRTDARRKECPHHNRQIALRGFVFSRLGDVSWQEWLHLLMHHTPGYLPQPYQQLAGAERTNGHETNARMVLIAQQEDLCRRAPEFLGGRVAWLRHWLWGWLGRYGYRAHRLVFALALMLVLSGFLGFAAGQVPTRSGHHHAAERVSSFTAPDTTPGNRCTPIELIGLGIDRGLPLGATGLRARCDLDTNTEWGQVFTGAMWAAQALVWAFATLAVAAYTGLVRKPT